MNKYISKISKNTAMLFAFAAMGGGMLTSCCDYLEQHGATNYSPEQVYQDAAMTRERVNSLYGALTSDRLYGQNLVINFCNNTDIECVDGMYEKSTHKEAGYRGWGNYEMASLIADSRNYDMYNELFAVVVNANDIISGVNKYIATSGENAAQQNASKAEAMTLRAIAYLDLIRLYGDVTYNFEKPNDDASIANSGKVNRDVILDTLIADLQEAAPLLPWAGENGYTTERITKGYAYGLLAQIALTRAGWAIREGDMNAIYGGKYAGQYETAETAKDVSDAKYPTQRPIEAKRKELYNIAKTALEAAKAGPHSLNSSFENLWAGIDAAQSTYNADPEILFQIPYGLNKSGELGYSVGIRLKEQTSEFGYTNSTGHMSLTAKLIYDYDKGDERRPVTCAPYSIINNDGKGQDDFVGNKPFAIACGKWNPRKMSNDWRQINLNAGGKFGYGINYIKMRYAQILLMYAEVLNELDDIEGAKNQILELRKRAFSNDIATATNYVSGLTTKKQVADAIMLEEELEFAGEGIRKWDLIRWNKLSSAIRETCASVKGHKNVNNNRAWDSRIGYNYKPGSTHEFDNASYSYGENFLTEIQVYSAGYQLTANFVGKDDNKQNLNAEYYCGGLIGSPERSIPVINRYLLPLPAQTITSSNGMMENSYGYAN